MTQKNESNKPMLEREAIILHQIIEIGKEKRWSTEKVMKMQKDVITVLKNGKGAL